MVKVDKTFKVMNVLPEQIMKNKQGNTIHKGVKLNTDGTLTLLGVASTSNPDLHGDVITTECINKMKEKASSLNIHADHIYDIDDVIGTITEVLPSEDDELKIKFNIIPSIAPKIKELLDTGVKLGLSIGGKIKEYYPNQNDDGELIGWKITDINLFEVSLTPLPANWDTYGTVQTTSTGPTEAKCITGACALIRKSQQTQEYKKKKMEELETLKAEVLEIKKELDATKSELEETQTELTETKSELQETKTEFEESVETKEVESTEENETVNVLTEETIVNMFNEMGEALKAEVLEEIKSQIEDTVKTEDLASIKSEILETVKTEVVEATKTQIETFRDEIIGEVQNRITELEEKLSEDEEEEDDGKVEVVEETAEEAVNTETVETKETETTETVSVADEMKTFLDEVKSLIEENKVDVESLKAEVKNSVEGDLIKNVEEQRTPTATPQPTETDKPLSTRKKIDVLKANKKSVDDIAQDLAEKPSTNPFVNLLQEVTD